MLVLAAADESDEEEEAGQHQQAAASPASRISTSMVNQATAHLQKNGRSEHSHCLALYVRVNTTEFAVQLAEATGHLQKKGRRDHSQKVPDICECYVGQLSIAAGRDCCRPAEE